MRKSQLCHYCVGINKVEVLFTKGFILKLQENNLHYFVVVGTKLLSHCKSQTMDFERNYNPGPKNQKLVLCFQNKYLRALIEVSLAKRINNNVKSLFSSKE